MLRAESDIIYWGVERSDIIIWLERLNYLWDTWDDSKFIEVLDGKLFKDDVGFLGLFYGRFYLKVALSCVFYVLGLAKLIVYFLAKESALFYTFLFSSAFSP